MEKEVKESCGTYVRGRLASFDNSGQYLSELNTLGILATYVRNGPSELFRSAAVRLNGARPSQRTGVPDATTALAIVATSTESFMVAT